MESIKGTARAGPFRRFLAAEAATSESKALVALKIAKIATDGDADMALVPSRGKRLDELSTGPPDQM